MTERAAQRGELIRYSRQIVLREVRAGQHGCARGGRVVGGRRPRSPAILYLAAAGVGRLTLIDDDRVTLDNLQRQVVHDTAAWARPRRGARGAASTPSTRSPGAHRRAAPRRRDAAELPPATTSC